MNLRIIGAIATTATAFAVALAGTVVTREDGTKATVDWESEPPQSPVCVKASAMSSAKAVADYKLTARTGRAYEYVTIISCSDKTPTESEPLVPSGMDLVPGTVESVAYELGWPKDQVWVQGAADDPSPCLCGPGCEWQWPERDAKWSAPIRDRVWDPVRTPYRVRENAGLGACVKTACSELQGLTARPPECQ